MMINVDIKKVELDNTIKERLIAFSEIWVSEQNCIGIVANTEDDLKDKEIYLAYHDNDVVGYLLGHVYVYDKLYAAIEKDDKVFEVDELYIDKKYRSQGVGKALFFYAEEDMKNEVDYFTLSTTNKKRESIFHFYLDELGMNFWSARFFKKV